MDGRGLTWLADAWTSAIEWPNRCFLPTNGPAGLSRFARLAAEARDVTPRTRDTATVVASAYPFEYDGRLRRSPEPRTQ